MKDWIAEIYDNRKDELDMFNFHPEDEDDEKEGSYIYAWYTKSESRKYFYIGKGKGKRYNHILKEISDYEENPRKYKGQKYKWLKDEFGIECEILYEKITEAESSVLEAYTITTMLEKKEPLLNVVLPAVISDEESDILEYRNSYFYEKNTEKFLEYYR